MKNTKNKSQKKEILEGTIRISSKPLGFVEVEGYEEDIVIYEEELNTSLNKDKVRIEILGKDFSKRGALPRFKGKVLEILERNRNEFVGTLEKSPFGLELSPDDWKFYTKIEIKNPIPENARAGLKALVKINEWKSPALKPKGEIISIIGEKGVHETEMQSIILSKGIVYDFPKKVEEEAKAQQERFSPESPRVSSLRSARLSSQNFPAGLERIDFRNITTFTIDPKDAKDFDDALSFEELEAGKLRIGVHIADVSHFVRPGSELDKEARKREFSVYLVDRTIPMLPEILSNDLCSLNPNVDRFAFSAVFDIEKETGKVLDRWFGKTIINSDKRFSYEEAQEVLDSKREEKTHSHSLGHEDGGSRENDFSFPLLELDRIANIYRAENKKNGAIEFETDEVKFELDSEGKPIKVYKKPRLETMKMIEEWMLLANREVAKFISDKIENGGASIFRIHNLPNMERLEDLAIFIRALGHDLPIKNDTVSAKDLNRLFSQIEGHPSESLIKTAAVRSMAKAEYSTKNIGHFGLAFDYYTHFTSPIRRYPDLIIHRIMQKHLTGSPINKNEIEELQAICEEASEKEVAAAEAERESIKYKQVEFMQSKVGVEFEAIISGVTEWGMYVEDPETKAEGLVRLKDIGGDYYSLDEKNYAIVGEKTKNKFTLGDKIKVKLISADLDRKTLDFKLV